MPALARRALLAAGFFAALSPAMAQAKAPLLFAAASLAPTLEEIAAAMSGAFRISGGASATLARQIEAGAPAAAFACADPVWMARLIDKGLIERAAVTTPLSNTLVLAGRGSSPASAGTVDAAAIRAVLARSRLVLADPASAPLGAYAKAALEALGVWADAQGKLVFARDAREAAALAARGAGVGVLYATDAAEAPGLRVIGRFDAASHPPILYALAPLKGAGLEGARLLALITTEAALGRFRARGFTTP